MQSIFDKIGKAASSAATNAASRAELMKETNRLKSEQNELKSEYSATKRKLSDFVFKQYQQGNLEDPELLDFCQKMQDLRDSIDELDEEIKNVKDEYESMAAERSEERID